MTGNLALSDRNPSQPWPSGNVRLGAAEAAKIIAAPVPQLGKLDVQPREPIAATVPPQVLDRLRGDVDSDRDFWGNVRDPFQQAGACRPSPQPRPIEARLRALSAPLKFPAIKTPQ